MQQHSVFSQHAQLELASVLPLADFQESPDAVPLKLG